MSDFDFLLKPSTLFLLGLIIIPTLLLEGYYRNEEGSGKKGVFGAASTGFLVGIIATMATVILFNSF
ncbi:hypothetical protein HZB78_05580 [Candidatus Collierbacteria bacterium]|nr:hypothetical protein [Candidatus Collierbacteria bacterium]